MNQAILLAVKSHSIVEGGSYVSISLRNGKTVVDSVIKSDDSSADAMVHRAVQLFSALGVKCQGCKERDMSVCGTCERRDEKANSVSAVFNIDGVNVARTTLTKSFHFNTLTTILGGMKFTVSTSLKQDQSDLLEVASVNLTNKLVEDGVCINQATVSNEDDEEETLDWLGGGMDINDIHIEEDEVEEDLSEMMDSEEEKASDMVFEGTSYRDNMEAQDDVFITDPFGNQVVIEKPQVIKPEETKVPEQEVLSGFVRTGNSSYTTNQKEAYKLTEESARRIFALPRDGQGSFYAMNTNTRKKVAKDVEITVATDREYVNGVAYSVALATIKKGQTSWFCYSALQTNDLHEVTSKVISDAIKVVMVRQMANSSITVFTSVYNYNIDMSNPSFVKGPLTNNLMTFKDRLANKGVNLSYKYQSKENQSYMQVGANMTLTMLLEQNGITRQKKHNFNA